MANKAPSELKIPPIPEFMVRIKLPRTSSFAACPSGDTDYSIAYDQALRAGVPPGYEISPMRGNQRYPVDSEGYAYIRLRCVDETVSVAHWMERTRRAELKLAEIHSGLSDILKQVPPGEHDSGETAEK